MIKIKQDTIGRTWIYIEGDTKPKGYVYNGIYNTTRYRKAMNGHQKHFYEIGQGYPIDFEILEWLEEHEINNIVITEKNMDGDKKYKATVKQYLSANGKNDFNWGYGRQKNVPLIELSEIE